MKKKVLSIILSVALCLSMMPGTISAEAADGYTGMESPAVSGNEGAGSGEGAGNGSGETGTAAGNGNEGTGAAAGSGSEGTGTAAESAQTENTVSGNAAQSAEAFRVQSLIDALPAPEELQAADMQTQQEIYEALQEAYDAYEALTEEEQALLSGADCFEALFGWFNAQVSTQDTAAENVHGHCCCGKHTLGGRCPFSSSFYVRWEAIKDTGTDGKISAEELQTQIENAEGSNFYLTADAELDSTYVVAADKNLYLCLNGHSLTGTMSDGPVIEVKGRLILTDCSEAGTGKVTHGAGKTGSGIYCTATGWLDMYGGSITGNEATNGGGVCCEGKFYMYGGKITDNKATNGGGVYLAKDGDVVPTIELNGGEISSNTATNGGGIYTKDLMFTINGTKVSKNKATGNGGGICLGSTALPLCILESGEISGNEATGNGGGVYGDSPFNTQGGSITGNHADGQGGGVALSKVCYLDGSIKISGNTAGSGTSAKDSNLYFLSSFKDLWCVSVQDDFCGEVSLTVADGATLTSPTNSVVNWTTGAPSGTIKMDDGTGSIDEAGNVVDHAHDMGTDGKCTVSTCGKELVASVTPSGGSPVYYTALSSAINSAGAGETVTVLSDATLPNNYKITKGITLDLNGKTVTVNGTGGALYVLAENVTIQDGNAASGGTIKDTEGTLIKVSVGDWNENSGGLTVEGGTLGNIEIMSGSSFALTGGRIGELGFYHNAGTVKLSGGVLSGIGNWASDDIKVENFLQTGYALKKTVSGTGSYLGVSERKAVKLTALTGDDYYEVVPAPLTDVTADVMAAEVTYGASSSPKVTVNATQGTASSGENITYQWFVDGTEESGQTGSSYTFSSTHDVKTDNGAYTVKCEVSCDGYTVEVEKPITVKRASYTATVSMTDYTYGTTPSTPGVTGNLGDGAVNFYYNATDSTTGGIKWENIEADTLNAGTYYLYAVIAEGTNYSAYTTPTVAFTIAKAEPVVTWPTVKDVYVGDTLDNSYLNGGSAEAGAGNVPGSFSVTGTTSWAESGVKTTALTFTPEDTANYNAVTNKAVSVKVVKRTVSEVTTVLNAVETKPFGTALADLGLPETVSIETADGKQFENIPVTWDEEDHYNPQTLTVQTLTGSLDLTKLAAEAEQPTGAAEPVTARIQVTLQALTADAPAFADANTTYDGTRKSHALTALPIGVASVRYEYEGTDGTEYPKTETAPMNAGSYTVTAGFTMADGYAQLPDATAKLTIARRDIAAADIVTGAALTANGETQAQTLASVKLGELTLTAEDYELSGNTASEAGEYVLTIRGKGNFCGEATKGWTLAAQEVTDADGGSTTPDTDGGSTTPDADGGSTTPDTDGGSTTPETDGGSTTPETDGGSTTPETDGGTGSSAAAAPVSYGWADVDALLRNLIGAGFDGTAYADGNINVRIPGENVIPAYVLRTLCGTELTLALQQGSGVALSISGSALNETQLSGLRTLDLTTDTDARTIPEELIRERSVLTYRQLTIRDTGRLAIPVNLHVNMGAENAGRYANFYRYNAALGRLEYCGTFRITENGQAMTGLRQGGSYLVTVTDTRPVERYLFSGDSYTVQSGDTLSKIARRYRMSLAELLRRNPTLRNPNRIRVGQTINVL